MKARRFVVVLSIMLAAAWVACFATSCATTERKPGINYCYPSAEVKVNSVLMAHRIRVTDLRSTIVNGLPKVQMTAENVTPHELTFEYRFTWFDKDGFEVQTPLSTWVTVVSQPRDSFNMFGVAPSPNATCFKLTITPPCRW